jgi:hypothetical protein
MVKVNIKSQMRQFGNRGSMWRRSVRMHFADRYGLLPRRVHIGPKREVWSMWAHMESRGSSWLGN